MHSARLASGKWIRKMNRFPVAIEVAVCTVSTASEISTRLGTDPVKIKRTAAVSQIAPSTAHRPASRPPNAVPRT